MKLLGIGAPVMVTIIASQQLPNQATSTVELSQAEVTFVTVFALFLVLVIIVIIHYTLTR